MAFPEKTMRKIIYTACTIACLLSCAQGYKIKGESSISSIEGKAISLKAPNGQTWRTLDSCEVLHGKFAMKGKVDSTLIATLFLNGYPLMPIILEPGKCEVTISDAALKVEGTPLNDSLYKFIANKYELDLRALELERLEAQMIMNGYRQDEIQQRIDSTFQTLNEEMHTLVRGFIKRNYTNVLSLCGFSMLCNGLPRPIITPLIQSVVDDAPKSFLDHPTIKEFLHEARENIASYDIALQE